MQNTSSVADKISQGAYDRALSYLYHDRQIPHQRERYCRLLSSFSQVFPNSPAPRLFSAPGRTEISGNHTDHQRGCVVAASINLDRVEPQIIGPIDAWGRARPIQADVPLLRIPCDIVVVAIGQGIETRHFEEAGISVKRGTITAMSDSEVKDVHGVFAGGDCVTGPATVIRAIAAGKVAAANIDEYLGYHHVVPCDVEIPPVSYEDKEPCGRIQLSEKEAGERKTNFDAFECGMTKQEACQEAGRCLRCDKYGYGSLKGGRAAIW